MGKILIIESGELYCTHIHSTPRVYPNEQVYNKDAQILSSATIY